MVHQFWESWNGLAKNWFMIPYCQILCFLRYNKKNEYIKIFISIETFQTNWSSAYSNLCGYVQKLQKWSSAIPSCMKMLKWRYKWLHVNRESWILQYLNNHNVSLFTFPTRSILELNLRRTIYPTHIA